MVTVTKLVEKLLFKLKKQPQTPLQKNRHQIRQKLPLMKSAFAPFKE